MLLFTLSDTYSVEQKQTDINPRNDRFLKSYVR